MKLFWRIMQFLLAIFLVYAGIQHFLKPQFYEPFVPGFLPFKIVIIYVSGILEMVLGIGLFFPKYAKLSATGITLLMLIFLPIHIWDVFAENPAIGSHKAALIRLPVQLLFIAWAFKIRQVNSS